MNIDFISDVICPWCFIGLTRLDQALGKAGVPLDVVRFHPFQLDPSTPPEGADLRERLRAKYGRAPEKMFERVEAAAKESGIDLDFAKVRRTPNTLKAHALIAAAEPLGTQHAVARALFDAYFLAGVDVGSDDALVAIATEHGLSRETALALLADEHALEEIRRRAGSFAAQGIGGVPFVIFDDKIAISGAQPPDVFARAIARALTPA